MPYADAHQPGGRPRAAWVTSLLVGAVLAAGTIACNDSDSSSARAAETKTEAPDDGDQNGSEAARRALPVEVWTIESRTFEASFEVPGVMTAERDVRVAFETAGRITTIDVSEGDTVERGQRLARVSTDADRSRIELLESQFETAKREYNRVKNLADEGLASEQELDQAESRKENARLSLEQARTNVGNATITAPISGVVAERYADEGEFASPGTPLVDLVDTSKLQLEASVPESRIDDIEPGMEMNVRFPTADYEVTGTVPFLPARVNSRTRTYPVEVQLPPDKLDNRKRTLRPGTRADITVPYESYSDAIVIPRNAVLLGYDRNEVVVIPDPDAAVPRAEVRTVKLGPGRGNRVVVTDGLDAGESLVVLGHRALTDGAPVDIVNQPSSLEEAGSR